MEGVISQELNAWVEIVGDWGGLWTNGEGLSRADFSSFSLLELTNVLHTKPLEINATLFLKK